MSQLVRKEILLLIKKAKIIALLKPNKAADDPKSNQPVEILSIRLKPLERLILNCPRVEDRSNPQKLTGFRPSRSCTYQVSALTILIEYGFQKIVIDRGNIVDLTATYNTIWKKCVIYKLMKVTPCLKI